MSAEILKIVINNVRKSFYGSALISIGDTLALQEFGGFFVGVGKAIKFCRICEIKYDERLVDLTDIYFERYINRHHIQLEII